MKKAFTLIELIFVIVIIGLLASYAVPKFMTTKMHASTTSAKSIVSSVRTAIETKHGEWMIDDSLDSSNGYTPQGYPIRLDDASLNSAGENLFDGTSKLQLLKRPIKSCLGENCWVKTDENNDTNQSTYEYKITNSDYIDLNYSGSDGNFSCIGGGGSLDKTKCEELID